MSRRRRKRFKVTRRNLTTGEERCFHALLYTNLDGDPNAAGRKFCQAPGWEVLWIEPVERKKRQRSLVRRPWEFSTPEVDAAIAELGLQLPVVLTSDPWIGTTMGNHRLVPAGKAPKSARLPSSARLFHRIMVKTYLNAEQAGRTTWHELTHAAQAERAIREAFGVEAFNRPRISAKEMVKTWIEHPDQGHQLNSMRRVRYEDRPIEVEARAAEERHSSSPLVVDISGEMG